MVKDSMPINKWNDLATLKNIKYLAIEYTYIERLISVGKFINYYKNNWYIIYLIKRWGEDNAKFIIKSILKESIKERQKRGW